MYSTPYHGLGGGVRVPVGRGGSVGFGVLDGICVGVGYGVSVGNDVSVGMGAGVSVDGSIISIRVIVAVGIRVGEPDGVRVGIFGTYNLCPV